MPYPRIQREIEDIVVKLYRTIGRTKIARKLGVAEGTVQRILKRRGIKVRPRGVKGYICLECTKPTGGAMRCKRCKQLRAAEQSRNWHREHHGVKKPYFENI